MKFGAYFTTVAAAVVILSLATAAGAGPAAPSAGAPTVVGYQGQVSVDRTPYDGAGYFKFAVVNAAGDTTYWSNDGESPPENAVALAVDGGRFAVMLGDTALEHMTPLPASVFAEPERYLRVWFSADDVSFTLLEPDRRIASAPYALQAANADTLDGLHAAAFQMHYDHVVVVAKSGGDYTSIQAALNAITASASSRYLVKVAPGTYNERVTMEPYVDIEGSGEGVTTITYAGDPDGTTGTVVGASNAELRFVTVENTGGAAYAFAVFNSYVSPRLTHVTAKASGGDNNTAVVNFYSLATLTDVTAVASGAGINIGVKNSVASAVLTDVNASATGGSYGIGVWSDSMSTPVLTNVTATASASTVARGVHNAGASPVMTHLTATASGGGYENYGVFNSDASPAMRGVTASASGPAGSSNYGVYNNNAFNVTMVDVTAGISGGNYSYGVLNANTTLSMTRVSASATGASTAAAVYNNRCSPTMLYVTASCTGSSTCYGVQNYMASPIMDHMTITAEGSAESRGVYNDQSSPVIRNSAITAGGSGPSFGLWNGYPPCNVKVHNSQVSAANMSLYNLTGCTVYVGASQLAALDITCQGTCTCVGVYDEFFASAGYTTCP